MGHRHFRFAAALPHATAACVAGGNPDLHVRIPNLEGFDKDEVIIPTHSRNVYDSAIRSVGVRIIEVANPEEFENALGPRAAMVYIFAGPRADNGPLPYETITRIAKQRNVPVLVDAAADILTVPNVHLQRGATLVGYSGGKALRGPQSAGILLGRKDLVQAAWVHSAPHHGHGRSMKFGKEEAMGMLMAVEMWMKRDHKAEMKQWIVWLNTIAERVGKVEGVTTSVREPRELSNHSPVLSIRWDAGKLGISGEEVAKILIYNRTPHFDQRRPKELGRHTFRHGAFYHRIYDVGRRGQDCWRPAISRCCLKATFQAEHGVNHAVRRSLRTLGCPDRVCEQFFHTCPASEAGRQSSCRNPSGKLPGPRYVRLD